MVVQGGEPRSPELSTRGELSRQVIRESSSKSKAAVGRVNVRDPF